MTVTTSSRWTRTLALLTVGVASVTLSGCALLDQLTTSDEATRDDSGQVIEGNENTDVFTLQVGDCVNDASASETIDTLPTVPCSEPHDSEVYASIIMSADTFPGEDAVLAEADASCIDAFSAFAGIPYADSVYFLSYYFPTDGSWSAGDREILCIIYDGDGQTTGSLENIGR